MSAETGSNSFFKVIATSEVYQGGKVLIPKKVRDQIGLGEDGTVIWVQVGDKVFIDTALRDSLFRPIWREWAKKDDVEKEQLTKTIVKEKLVLDEKTNGVTEMSST